MTDPRRPGGDIAGPGGPHDRQAVVVDATDAVLLDHTTVALVETDSGPAIALKLEGKINRVGERAEILYLMPLAGAVNIVAELTGLFARAAENDEALAADFLVALEEAMEQVPGRRNT